MKSNVSRNILLEISGHILRGCGVLVAGCFGLILLVQTMAAIAYALNWLQSTLSLGEALDIKDAWLANFNGNSIKILGRAIAVLFAAIVSLSGLALLGAWASKPDRSNK